jgi:hypothetical protein
VASLSDQKAMSASFLDKAFEEVLNQAIDEYLALQTPPPLKNVDLFLRKAKEALRYAQYISAIKMFIRSPL